MCKTLDHGSDIAIVVKNTTIEGLVKELVYCTFSLLIEKPKKIYEKTVFNVESDFSDDCLIDLLNTFLTIFYTKKLYPYRLHVRYEDKIYVKAYASVFSGELKTYIKAATMCDAKLEKTDKYYTMKVVFDV